MKFTPLSKLAVVAALALGVSSMDSQAAPIAVDDFTSISGGSGFSNNWNDSALIFSPTGATSNGYVDTTRTLSSAITLGATSTWFAMQMDVDSYVDGNDKFFNMQIIGSGDPIQLGVRYTPAATNGVNWRSIIRDGGGYQAIGYPGAVTGSQATNTFLARVTHDGTNLALEGWVFNSTSLPSGDPTGAANGAVEYGAFSYAVGNQITGIKLSASWTTGTFEALRIGTDYASVQPIPEPTTWVLTALGMFGVALIFRRRKA